MLDISGLWAVLCLLIIAPSVLLGFGLFLHHERAEKARLANPKKRTVVPQKAYAQPGICMCDDAFNFHIDGKRCNVEGCPCVVFVPSDAEEDVLKEIGLVGMSRMAIEGVNAQMDWQQKKSALEQSREQVMAIQAEAQIGPKNKPKNVPCPECDAIGPAHYSYCSRG